jgi:hypothetical protein
MYILYETILKIIQGMLACLVETEFMTTTDAKARVKVADEVWVATALLHRKHPDRSDFSIEEIMESARQMWREGTGSLRPGVYIHVVQHCVANRPPSPGRVRMLVETAAGRRRLFRPGDYYHPEREGAKTTPRREDLPHGYSSLLNWYRDWCSNSAKRSRQEDPLLALRGSGKHIWADEHADEYVRRLREGWE